MDIEMGQLGPAVVLPNWAMNQTSDVICQPPGYEPESLTDFIPQTRKEVTE